MRGLSLLWRFCAVEFSSAISHVFFAKDVMGKPAYTGVEMNVRNERFVPGCVHENDRFGGASGM
jgi:hypothetical protein